MTCCLPDELWTDPGCLLLAAKHIRLWKLLVAIARLRARWMADDVDQWTPAQWVIMLRRDTNVNTNERQWGLDLVKLRNARVLDTERVDLRFCRRNPAAGADEDFVLPGLAEAGMPRRKFRSDDPQYRREKAASKVQLTPQSTPPNSADDSTSAPPNSASGSAIDSTTDTAKLAIASLAEKENFNTASLAEAQLSSGAPEGKPESYRPKHKFPNSEEIAALEGLGYKRGQIEEAVRAVTARKNFQGVGRWEDYLPKVLREMFPDQTTMNVPVIVEGGQHNNAQTPGDNHRAAVEQSLAFMRGEGPPPGAPPPMDVLRGKVPPVHDREKTA